MLDLFRRVPPPLGIRVEEHDDSAEVFFDEYCDFGTARDAALIAIVIGFWRVGVALTGKELEGDVDFAFPEPAYFSRFAHRVPGRARFSQPANRAVFDRALLDAPLAQADPDALRLARIQCERELERLGPQPGFSARVRVALGACERELPSIEVVARELATSPRTLKRKLAEEGTSFSELVDGVQLARAVALLRSNLNVDEVADRIGYSDAANFTRAFRRWTGKSPSEYRKG